MIKNRKNWWLEGELRESIWRRYFRIRNRLWQVENLLRKISKRFGYWLHRTKWNVQAILLILGIKPGRAYYVSASYGDDENSGQSIFDPVRTYDEAQGLAAEGWYDIIIVIDRDSENMKPWHHQSETGNCWGRGIPCSC